MKTFRIIFLCLFLALAMITMSTPMADADIKGMSLYTQHCSACHQSDGKGIPGFFPPLAGNTLVTSDKPEIIEEYLERIIFGYHGGLVVEGILYYGSMPPIGQIGRINDSELLDLINYQRTAWGNKGKPLTSLDIARARQARWKFLLSTKGLCTMHYDSKNISYLPGNRAMVWIRTSLSPTCRVFEEEKKLLEQLGEKYKDYEYNNDLYEINCSDNTFRLVETQHLTKDEKIIHTDKHTGSAKGIPSDSVLETVRSIVCQ